MIKHKAEKGREGTRDKGNERRKGGRERKEKKRWQMLCIYVITKNKTKTIYKSGYITLSWTWELNYVFPGAIKPGRKTAGHENRKSGGHAQVIQSRWHKQEDYNAHNFPTKREIPSSAAQIQAPVAPYASGHSKPYLPHQDPWFTARKTAAECAAVSVSFLPRRIPVTHCHSPL